MKSALSEKAGCSNREEPMEKEEMTDLELEYWRAVLILDLLAAELLTN